MIVNRRTFRVKRGRAKEAARLLAREIAAEKGRGGHSGATRICTSDIGQFDQVAFEWEYASLAEYETGWAEWATRPTTAAFLETWYDITLGGSSEIWDLGE